jgi:heme a synthase
MVQFRKQGTPLLRKLTFAALILTMIVVAVGAFTRLVDAGLGCPDWPGCYGFLTVPTTETRIQIAETRFPDDPVEIGKGWAEMGHRYVAGLLMLLILAIAVIAWRQRREHPTPVILPFAIVAMVCLQAAFGMWTVTLKLWPQVVTLHLLGGFATLSLLFLLSLRLNARPVAVHPAQSQALPKFKPWALGAILVVVLQISLGGWTSSNYAALACPDFPTCQEQYWPEMDFAQGFNIFQQIGPNYLGGLMHNEARVAIHVMHRLGALVVTLYLAILLWRLWRVPGNSGMVKPIIAVALALVLQLALGVSNIIWLLPLSVAVAHNAGGAVLLLTLIWLNERIYAAEPTTVIEDPHESIRPSSVSRPVA